MSTGDAPAPSEQVTATPPAPTPAATGEGIALPPTPADAPAAPSPVVADPPTPAPPKFASPKFVRRLVVLDAVLAGLLLVVAFQFGCFRASNHDVYLHLAAGRAVAQGKLFAPDPFAFTTDAVWVNHSWLPDLVAYHLHGLPRGGAVLVVLKSLLVAILAGVLLRAAVPRGRLALIPVLCVMLAMLTLSPRLLLQSPVLSFLLLGVTLLLLERARAGGKVSLWMLPAVCLVWVNCDSWFLLGPLAVALYLAGELLQKVAGEDGEASPLPPVWLAVVLLACLAACVVNPFHVRAFTLPASLQFGEAATLLAEDNQFKTVYLAPWDELYFNPRIGLSVAGMAYFALLLAGLISFGMTAPRWRWWRVLVWLGFAALSLFNVRGIPFFAIVAGPIAALNFLDGATHYFGTEVKGDLNSKQMAVVGRFFTATAVLALIVAGVSGWLQYEPHVQREFGVGIYEDEGLRSAAEQVAAWRDDGTVAQDAHFFNTSPEIASYFAWYCPGAKTYLDARLTPFDADVVRDYRGTRKALSGEALPKEDDRKQTREELGWRPIFARSGRKVDYVVFHASDALAMGNSSVLQRLYGNPREFVPAHASGGTSVFAYHGKDGPGPDAKGGIDFPELAFGRERAEKAPLSSPPTPPEPAWYQILLPSGLPAVRERHLAWQYRERFDALRPLYAARIREEEEDFIRATIAAFGVGAGGVVGLPRLGLVNTLELQRRILGGGYTTRPLDRGPPDSLYLAVRASRRALHDDPKDVLAHRTLGEAYLYLGALTREGRFAPPPLLALRQAQATVALRRALEGDPYPELAIALHQQLIGLYAAQGFLDLQVKHAGEQLKLSRGLKPTATRTAKQLSEGVSGLEKAHNKLESELKLNKDVYKNNALVAPPMTVGPRVGQYEKALEALLGETALEVLDKNQEAVGVKGRHVAIPLMLAMGQLDKARDTLGFGESEADRRKRKIYLGVMWGEPGKPAYEWLVFQVAVAGGDYKLAFDCLEDMIKAASVTEKDPEWGWVWEPLKLVKDVTPEQVTKARQPLRRRLLAQYFAARAWLKLEFGDVAGASEDARTSRSWSAEMDPMHGWNDISLLVGELADPKTRPKTRQ